MFLPHFIYSPLERPARPCVLRRSYMPGAPSNAMHSRARSALHAHVSWAPQRAWRTEQRRTPYGAPTHPCGQQPERTRAPTVPRSHAPSRHRGLRTSHPRASLPWGLAPSSVKPSHPRDALAVSGTHALMATRPWALRASHPCMLVVSSPRALAVPVWSHALGALHPRGVMPSWCPYGLTPSWHSRALVASGPCALAASSPHAFVASPACGLRPSGPRSLRALHPRGVAPTRPHTLATPSRPRALVVASHPHGALAQLRALVVT